MSRGHQRCLALFGVLFFGAATSCAEPAIAAVEAKCPAPLLLTC
jgi:hypothetical protein